MIEAATTRHEAIKLLLVDEELNDVTLKSNVDGTIVLAHRAMLAVRSPVFRKMFYGEFKKALHRTVELDYSGETIQAVVGYIYNDSVLDNVKTNGKDDLEVIQTIVSTMAAARFLELWSLQEKCQELAISVMNSNRAYCLPFLVACQSSASCEKVKSWAEWYICRSPSLLLENKAILSCLSYKCMESFVQTRSIKATEYDLFHLVLAWSTEGGDDSYGNTAVGGNDDKSDSSFDFEILENRVEAAKKLVEHIDLSLIEPVDLSTTVTASGLVDKDKLLEAFKVISLRKKEYTFCGFPRMMCWESSESDTLYASATNLGPFDCGLLEKLKCRPLTAGIFKWMILVEEMDGMDCLGVASAAHDTTKQPVVWNVPDWMVRPIPCRFKRNLDFGKGSLVTLVLDLTGPGELSASVDGHPVVKLFTNMKSAFFGKFAASPAFVPAVAVRNAPGRVRFMGFQYD